MENGERIYIMHHSLASVLRQRSKEVTRNCTTIKSLSKRRQAGGSNKEGNRSHTESREWEEGENTSQHRGRTSLSTGSGEKEENLGTESRVTDKPQKENVPFSMAIPKGITSRA